MNGGDGEEDDSLRWRRAVFDSSVNAYQKEAAPALVGKAVDPRPHDDVAACTLDMATLQRLENEANARDRHDPLVRAGLRAPRIPAARPEFGKHIPRPHKQNLPARRPIPSAVVNAMEAHNRYMAQHLLATVPELHNDSYLQSDHTAVCREREFELPRDTDRLISESIGTGHRDAPRVVAPRQRPQENVVDPHRMYPPDFNPNQMAHRPPPRFRSTFNENPAGIAMRQPRHDVFDLEPELPVACAPACAIEPPHMLVQHGPPDVDLALQPRPAVPAGPTPLQRDPTAHPSVDGSGPDALHAPRPSASLGGTPFDLRLASRAFGALPATDVSRARVIGGVARGVQDDRERVARANPASDGRSIASRFSQQPRPPARSLDEEARQPPPSRAGPADAWAMRSTAVPAATVPTISLDEAWHRLGGVAARPAADSGSVAARPSGSVAGRVLRASDPPPPSAAAPDAWNLQHVPRSSGRSHTLAPSSFAVAATTPDAFATLEPRHAGDAGRLVTASEPRALDGSTAHTTADFGDLRLVRTAAGREDLGATWRDPGIAGAGAVDSLSAAALRSDRGSGAWQDRSTADGNVSVDALALPTIHGSGGGAVYGQGLSDPRPSARAQNPDLDGLDADPLPRDVVAPPMRERSFEPIRGGTIVDHEMDRALFTCAKPQTRSLGQRRRQESAAVSAQWTARDLERETSSRPPLRAPTPAARPPSRAPTPRFSLAHVNRDEAVLMAQNPFVPARG
ncbi:Hypothetical protein UVM_LOCUS355 [uncultured virus]|nr:Hypothetical protein UVM_LOCUS355 [uncultured virus]